MSAPVRGSRNDANLSKRDHETRDGYSVGLAIGWSAGTRPRSSEEQGPLIMRGFETKPDGVVARVRARLSAPMRRLRTRIHPGEAAAFEKAAREAFRTSIDPRDSQAIEARDSQAIRARPDLRITGDRVGCRTPGRYRLRTDRPAGRDGDRVGTGAPSRGTTWPRASPARRRHRARLPAAHPKDHPGRGRLLRRPHPTGRGRSLRCGSSRCPTTRGAVARRPRR